ncbi:MAG: zinc ribbon domain-containing protein [Promethearchaeota archaeon]
MDITKFNKELGKKITMARVLESRNQIEDAVKIWLEISEMTLNLSKSKNLEVSFRNMLINRTKGIFEHIRQLKGEKSDEMEFIEEIETEETSQLNSSSGEKVEELNTISDEKEVQIKKPEENVDPIGRKVGEDTEFENIPEGFKEIKASEDFTIITPHDKEIIQKRLNQIEKSKISNQKQEQIPKQDFLSNQERFEFERPEDGKRMICFACGAKIEKNKKICPNCGANIE